MISREDMLELTRRMTVSRTSMTRIAGGYMDSEGFLDGSFNTHFLNLSTAEREKNLELAKAIPFARTNEQLKDYEFPEEVRRPGTMWHLLETMKDCRLKNDALLETFYELVGEKLHMNEDYAIFVFHDSYDVPVKGADKERQWESEEVYDYLVVSVFPVDKAYNPGKPVCGFLYPAFANRSCYRDHVAVFMEEWGNHPELIDEILQCR